MKRVAITEEEWLQVEGKVAAVAKNKAGKFARNGGVHYDFDDAFQEGRMALWLAMSSFDEEKGQLHSFAATVLENNYLSAMARIHTKSRNGFTVPIENGVDWSNTASGAASASRETGATAVGGVIYEHDLIDEDYDLERGFVFEEMETLLSKFKTELRARLSGFPAEVFDYRVCPALRSTISDNDEPSNIDLMDFFGVTKNKLDYALYVIKGEVTVLARKNEYADLFGDKIDTLRWPQWLHSDRAYDSDLIGKAAAKWSLDETPLNVREESGDGVWRCIEEYCWGTAVYWGNEEEAHTDVAVGRFNPATGDLFGASGTRESIPHLSKYRDVVKRLKGKR
jgi:DNA-directed RNA polymerase specialized sigma24 family protein